MGIQGLLPLLRSITDRAHLDSLSGQTVAVDAYSWLHKGAYSCSSDLFHARPTRAFIDFCLNRLKLLLNHNISVILVFDGNVLPAKQGKERERDASRQKARSRAEALLAEGKATEASPWLVKAIDVTPDMAKQLVVSVKRTFPNERVQCMVAPYEADAQLAFLESNGLVNAVISEDSDLLLFGVKRLCVKLDGRTGYFEEILSDRIQYSRDIDLRGCSLKRLRQMCILSGCDYLDSVNGMGLKTAHRYLSKYNALERVIQILRAEGRAVPVGYEEDFIKAEMVFSHQRIFNCRVGRLECLNPLNESTFSFSDDSFLGPVIPDSLAKAISESIVHPITHAAFSTLSNTPGKPSSWLVPGKPSAKEPVSSNYRITIKRKVNAEHALYFPQKAENADQNLLPLSSNKQPKTIRDYFQ